MDWAVGAAVKCIINMHACAGSGVDRDGIEWIAGFLGNRTMRKPRAHRVVILNDAGTGELLYSVNTALISDIRTVAVSALMQPRSWKKSLLWNIKT